MVSHACVQDFVLQMWNTKQGNFEVGPRILTIEVEDIYFLIGLSRRGDPISLTSSRGGDVTTQELIDHDCFHGTKMLGKKIPIKTMMDLPLWIVLFTMQWVVGRQGPQ